MRPCLLLTNTMINIFRIYQILIVLPLFVAVTLLASVVTLIMCLVTNGRFWGYYPAKIWAMTMCWINFVRVTVKGRDKIDKKTSYVFVANHQGVFDIFSVNGFLGHNFRWMMKASLIKLPVVGYTCKRSGHIFMDRRNASALRKSMELAEKQLSGGMSLVVFPEGSRSKTGAMAPFKRGAFLLATELNLPVVPLTISGAYKVMPRASYLPRPGHIVITIHDPIYPQADGHDMTTLLEQSYAAVSSAL